MIGINPTLRPTIQTRNPARPLRFISKPGLDFVFMLSAATTSPKKEESRRAATRIGPNFAVSGSIIPIELTPAILPFAVNFGFVPRYNFGECIIIAINV